MCTEIKVSVNINMNRKIDVQDWCRGSSGIKSGISSSSLIASFKSAAINCIINASVAWSSPSLRLVDVSDGEDISGGGDSLPLLLLLLLLIVDLLSSLSSCMDKSADLNAVFNCTIASVTSSADINTVFNCSIASVVLKPCFRYFLYRCWLIRAMLFL